MAEYKLIVAGGRDFHNKGLLKDALSDIALVQLADKSVSIVSGMANGADKLGWQFAKANGVQCYEFPADWEKYGKWAGYKRNEDMAKFSDGLLAFWDGKSRGTKHMIDYMKGLGKPVFVVSY